MSDKKVMIFGASGLIGKESLPYLYDCGYKVFAVSSKANNAKDYNWLQCNIFDDRVLKSLFEYVKPTHLLNFAWNTNVGYLESKSNKAFLSAGKNMLEYFCQNGGKKAIYAGTCFEYEAKGKILTENSPLSPKTLYAESKNNLREWCEIYSESNGLDFGWGRIFYVYVHNEKKNMLTSAVLEALNKGENFDIKTPNDIKDYMYTKDIAKAFVCFLESKQTGCVNICTGQGVSIKNFVLTIARKMGKEHLISFNNQQSEPLNIVGDNSILKNKICFEAKYTLKSAFDEILCH